MKQYLFELFENKEYGSNFERFKFKIPSLRVSLLGRCNENCFYCHNEGVSKKISSTIQTGDIINVIYSLKGFGLKKIKFTGGEPMLYKDLKNLLYKVKHISDLKLYITTNGTLIRKRIKDLSPNIIDKISVSLDTLDPEFYKYITGKDYLGEVLSGLKILKNSGYNVEIDAVLLKNINSKKTSLNELIDYCVNNDFDLQFIELSNETGESSYSKFYADPYATLKKAGLDFLNDNTNDRQFFKIKNSKITLCRKVSDVCQSTGSRCGGLRLLPNGVLKNFYY
ncbi:MAG: radical SAM protein [Candidatus Acidulodesulfobacterium sp.]